jgi:ABC-type glutathione transport system ATPase component
MSALLEIRGLTLEVATPQGHRVAVEGLDLAVASGETLALVGESGCGKTLTALAVLGVLPRAARVAAGEILWRGRDLLHLDPRARRALCGRELALSFQEPASAFDPVHTLGEQIAETLRHHARESRGAAWQRAIALLGEVGLEDPAEHARRHPHELSGGQRQRGMLAMALACGPSLLIADEPTSALDAPLQLEILALLARLRAQREMALLLVTHDLAVVAELADRVAVMQAGRIVEQGGVLELFERARHPYSQALLRARTSQLARLAHTAEGNGP